MSATTSAGADSAVGLYIDDRWREGGRRFDRVNPARPAEIIGQSTAASVEDVAEAFAAAQRAECAWARTPPPARADILVRAAAIIVERATEIARVLSLEEGSGFGDEACAAAGGEIVDMDQVFDEAEPFNVADGRVVHEIVSQAVEAARRWPDPRTQGAKRWHRRRQVGPCGTHSLTWARSPVTRWC